MVVIIDRDSGGIIYREAGNIKKAFYEMKRRGINLKNVTMTYTQDKKQQSQ